MKYLIDQKEFEHFEALKRAECDDYIIVKRADDTYTYDGFVYTMIHGVLLYIGYVSCDPSNEEKERINARVTKVQDYARGLE